MGVDMKYNWGTELAKRKIKDAGHVLRGRSGEFVQLMLVVVVHLILIRFLKI